MVVVRHEHEVAVPRVVSVENPVPAGVDVDDPLAVGDPRGRIAEPVDGQIAVGHGHGSG